MTIQRYFALERLSIEPAGRFSIKTKGGMFIFGLIIMTCDFSGLRVNLFATTQLQILLRFAVNLLFRPFSNVAGARKHVLLAKSQEKRRIVF